MERVQIKGSQEIRRQLLRLPLVGRGLLRHLAGLGFRVSGFRGFRFREFRV